MDVRNKELLIIETHPVQYHAPVYRVLKEAFGIDVTVLYGSNFSVAGYRDREFGASFAWDTDLTGGYAHEFLSRAGVGGARSFEEVGTRGLVPAMRRHAGKPVLILGYSHPLYRAAIARSLVEGRAMFLRGEAADHTKRRGPLARVGRDLYLRALYRSFRKLLYIGSRSRKHYTRLGVPERKLVFSPYCADAASFRYDEGSREAIRASFRAAAGIPSAAEVVIFCGKLTARKGLRTLAAAMASLKKNGRETGIAFAGSGDMENELRRFFAEAGVQSWFLGFRNQSALSECYHGADALILPSSSGETWGVVVNEALLHGLPCVVSTAVGCADDLVTTEMGAIFQAGDAEALAVALVKTLDGPRTPEARERRREHVSAFDVRRAAQGIAEALA